MFLLILFETLCGALYFGDNNFEISRCGTVEDIGRCNIRIKVCQWTFENSVALLEVQ